MDKKTTLAAIEKVKHSHEAQMTKIETLLDGLDVNNATPIAKSQCAFGQWLYAQDNHLEDILGTQFYAKLDSQHEQWHLQYVKIYNIFFKDKKTGFFAGLLGGNKVDDLLIDKAKMYYSELQPISDELIHTLDACHRRANAMSDTKFH
jgi:hypothetical protein